MMSMSAILSLREEAMQRARRRQAQPRVFFNQHDADNHFGSVPNFGDWRPKGWKLVEHRMVDKTGWGDESEPALTVRGYKTWLSEHLDDSSGWAIIEEGQFQIVVGRFVERDSRKA
jgi:hypothetical protein